MNPSERFPVAVFPPRLVLEAVVLFEDARPVVRVLLEALRPRLENVVLLEDLESARRLELLERVLLFADVRPREVELRLGLTIRGLPLLLPNLDERVFDERELGL